ncbi:MAG: hypothetical protein WCK02_08240 [Bacteroidota bacterium]
MKKTLIIMALPAIILFSQCKPKQKHVDAQTNSKELAIKQETIDKVIKTLKDSLGEKQAFRIERGVKQTATLWQKEDGNDSVFSAFCKENFIGADSTLNQTFEKLAYHFEVIWGNMNKMAVDLKRPMHLEIGNMLPIDLMMGGYEPSSHIISDFYNNKIAFVVTLNFPTYSLKEKVEQGDQWTRKQWAYARMGDLFTSRVPSELLLKAGEVSTNADAYISGYNICMGYLVDNNLKTHFNKDMKLITHWGLRDELKSHYADKDSALFMQNMIYDVMKRIINQDIPVEVINKTDYQWNPTTNVIYKDGKEVKSTPEGNVRYQHLLNNFHAMQAIDAYSPQYPTFIQRRFDEGMEMSQAEVEKLFTEFVSSPTVKQVGDLISKRLGRKLQPFDVWYDGFKARGNFNEADLDKKTQAKYPNAAALEADLANILKKLGFKADKAAQIVSHIAVDPARGSGHAWGSEMKTDKAHLRTRIAKTGMNYKGYNIAVHEFGHNVEQTLTLQDVDNYLMKGVPNTAFTEALAFIFQKRDLEIMGMKDNDPNKANLMALDNFWACYEIMGVSLLDMKVWKWLYENPTANADQLKEAVIKISKEVWNQYYAPVFGTKDEPILAIYSHMIDAPLYLSAYPIGHLIDFQIEQQITGKSFSDEVIRMYTVGRLTPQSWMKKAVGKEISIEPIQSAAKKALMVIK